MLFVLKQLISQKGEKWQQMKPNNEACAPYRSREILEAGVGQALSGKDWPGKHGMPKDEDRWKIWGGAWLLLSIHSQRTCDHLRGKSDLAKSFDRICVCN